MSKTIWLWALVLLLVSSVSALAQPVIFGDANLKAAVEDELGISNPTPTNMLELTCLQAHMNGITDLKGLEYAVNLTDLDLSENQISDISALSGLINLTNLDLFENQISDISALSGLTNLQDLWLYGNQISDISALSGLTNLWFLNLSSNQISDISALSGLTNLSHLILGYNQISDISAVSGLTNLHELHLSENQISDISALSGLINLIWLYLYSNQISDISAVSGMTNLISLYLYSNQISDISAVSGMTNLEVLWMRDNPLNIDAFITTIPDQISQGCDVYYGPTVFLSISSESGVTVTDPGEGLFECGTGYVAPISATITAGPGSVFWTGTAVDAGKVANPNAASTTVLMDGYYSLRANLNPIVEDPVFFADANLKAAVEAELGITDPTPTDMLGLTYLDASSSSITNLTGLEYATNLESLYLFGNQISDISALAGLTNIDQVGLYDNQIVDISALSGLTNLISIGLNGNQISDISALTGLTNLEGASLHSNKISNISALAGLTNLWFLTLSDNQVSDISVLAGLTGLTDLYLNNNQVSDISALAGLTNLALLWLGNNPLNNEAIVTYIPQIQTNNPGIDLSYGPIYTLDISSGAGGSVSEPGEGLYEYGEGYVADITGTSESGYNFAGWIGTAVNAGKVTSPMLASTVVTIDADYTLQANFSTQPPVEYTLTVSSGSGGSVTTPGEGSFNYTAGTVVPINATAAEGNEFVNWTGTAVDASKVANPSAASTSVTIDADYTLHANFTAQSPDEYTLSISSGSGGSVTAPGEGFFGYEAGTVAWISATADTDYEFVNWTGTAVDAGKVANPYAASTFVTVDADYTLQANFSESTVDYTLSISSGSGGSVTAPGEGFFGYEAGTVVSISATADTDYEFLNWTGTAVDAGKVTNPSAANTNVTVDADYTLEANFEAAPVGQADLLDRGESYRIFSPETVEAGQNFEVQTSIQNDSDDAAGPFTVIFYVSTDATITSSDYYLGREDLSGVSAYSSLDVAWSGLFPGSVPEGIYYVGWIIDAYDEVTESNENNNIAYKESYQLIVQENDGEELEPHLSVAPLANSGYFWGDSGGPFNPQYITYTLTNTGDELLAWQASQTQNWITLSQSTGILTAGAKVYINIGINDNANHLSPGTYKDTVTFTNQTNGNGNTTRLFTLTINAGGGIGPVATLYVDDDAPADPGPLNPFVSDPAENGSSEHPYDTVQEAIDAAQTSDVVLVLPGRYMGTIDMSGKAITVKSLVNTDPNDPETLGAIDNTVLDGACEGSVVVFDSGEDANCILCGFTITNGCAYSGAGILCDNSGPVISHCVITGNRATRYGGGAIDSFKSHATFINSTISGNYARMSGGAIACEDSRDTYINCIIWDNIPDSVYVASGQHPIQHYCDIEDYLDSTSTNVAADPSFVSPGYWVDVQDMNIVVEAGTDNAVWVLGDYHLQSRAGHYDPSIDTWIYDQIDSVLIDSGDPSKSCLNEPQPNGGRINVGAYGGTNSASKTFFCGILLYAFDLNTNPDWTIEGGWQYGQPQGAGGANGNPDPSSGFTGHNVYGVNLAGDYTVSPGGPYHLVAGPFDCSGHGNIILRFARWLNSDYYPYVSNMIEGSSDGVNWEAIWEATQSENITDNEWLVVEYDISTIAAQQETVWIRWNYTIVGRAFPYSGWNIDDIEILTDY